MPPIPDLPHVVTIKDVARIAGVSVATVSRVLNASGPVSPTAQRRVRAAAKQLGYVPNGAAQSLSKSRTSTLGVLLPALYGEFFSEVMRGIDGAARRAGHHLLLASSRTDTRELDAALRSMRGRVDGLIVMAPDPRASDLIAARVRDFPVVLVNTPDVDGISSITTDNFEGARAMVRHLVALGHRHVAMIAGPEHNHDAGERLRGYHAALDEAGVDAEARTILPGQFSEASGYRAAISLLRRRARPTALFAANDSMAIGALSALRERGLAVPDQIAVAGFDDVPAARYASPPISSVAIDIVALGQRATQRLLGLIGVGAHAPPAREIVATHLVIRQSCGGAPRSRSLPRTRPSPRGRPAPAPTPRSST